MSSQEKQDSSAQKSDESRVRSPTIRDVAKAAGVSPATVSRALNNTGYVGEDTRRRVMGAVTQLGYRPDWHARGLAGKSAGLIGVIVPVYSRHLYSEITGNLSGLLRVAGYDLVLCVNENDPDLDYQYLSILRDKGVDGIIYSRPAGGDNSAFVRSLAKSGMPIVELYRRSQTDLLDAVVADDLGGTYQLTSFMIGKGHTRIAFIYGEEHLSHSIQRLAGYTRAHTHARISTEADLIRKGSYCEDHGEATARELLQSGNPPTAIIANGVSILLGVMTTIRELGLRIPEDVSIGVFDDPDWLRVYDPPITAVEVATSEMAHMAVNLLLDRIEHPDSGPAPICYTLGTQFHERESCKDLASVRAVL